MDLIKSILQQHVELAVFATLALGFLIGRIRIGSFSVGPMLGCLFAGVIIGQLNIHPPAIVKVIFFDLFLFATGYKVGPQFFYGLKKDALPQLILTIVICVSCLITAFLVSKAMGYDVGTASGLLAGAFTESTVIGTASNAIQKLSIPDDQKDQLVNNIPIAYAVTYIVGTTALVWFLSTGIPKLIRIKLREEAEKLGKKFHSSQNFSSDLNSAYKEWKLRAFTVISDEWAGLTVRNFENKFPGDRIIVQRIRKAGRILEPEPGLKISKGDTVVVSARSNVMLDKLGNIGPEVIDKELLDFPIMNARVFISKRKIAGNTLSQLARDYGQGIMLNKIFRSGEELPFEPGTIVHAGDILSIQGRQDDVERVTNELGFGENNSSNTDIIFVAIGIVLGGLIGLLSTRIGGVAITLSTSGGALLMGLVFGWVHSRTPQYGKIPEAALWIFDTMGLATFLGIVGLSAGPTFISGLKHIGFGIIGAGLIVALVPHILGMLVGRFILKMNPLILLGAQSGAGTTTTALKAIQDAAGSKLPVLGYTIPYALGNILLTAWGPVIVSLMTK